MLAISPLRGQVVVVLGEVVVVGGFCRVGLTLSSEILLHLATELNLVLRRRC